MKIHDNFLRFNIILVTSLLVSCAAQPPVPEDNFYQLPAPQITARAKIKGIDSLQKVPGFRSVARATAKLLSIMNRALA